MKLTRLLTPWRLFGGSLRSKRRRQRERRAIESSRIFDRDFYLRRYPDLAASGVDPIEHFLRFGAGEGRLPSAVFDPGWYVETYPDVAANGHNPLAHYILFGAAEGRDPNPLFSTRWYATNNPAAHNASTPLDHFVVEGAAALRDPSLGFNMAWYARQNSDARDEGLDPLSHYLLIGRAQGRPPSPLQSITLRGDPVEDAWLVTVKPVQVLSDRPVLVLVTHAPGPNLKLHVPPYLSAFLEAGVQVVLIVATEQAFQLDALLLGRLSGCVMRENRGYDFAAWAHVLRQNRELFASSTLILANDSVALRTGANVAPDLLKAIAQNDADLVGLTQSEERGWHLQSYFLALKSVALSTFTLHNFLAAVRILDGKDAVIQSYEVIFSGQMQAAGLRCAALFSSQDATNQTVFHWRALIAHGFPFVKVLVLQGEFPTVDITDWETWLDDKDFDIAAIQGTIAAKTASVAAPTGPLTRTFADPATLTARPKIAFIGPWNYANGLGAAGRGYLSALWRLDIDLNLHPVKTPFHVHERITPAVDVCDFIGPADLVVIHLNPDSWHLMTPDQQAVVTHARARVGLWVWEMNTLPDAWRANLNRVDAIWAPSRYCAEVFGRETTAPVFVTPHVVTVNVQEGADEAATLRSELGLALDDRIILYVFDGASYLVRKNPHVLVRAFHACGLAGEGWKLVLKTKHLMDRSEEGEALTALASATRGVTIVDRAMSPMELSALFDLADIYASPHRSEGFGLTIAEAMAKGKIVVASDYGGSRDFLDAGCGFPVAVQLKALDTSYGHYTRGAAWAEIDEAAFAVSLRAAADAATSSDDRLAMAARDKIALAFSADAVAQTIQHALAGLGLKAPRKP